jgi:hypothetical protein
LEKGIEIWNIATQKLEKYINRKLYSLTKIDKINSFLFACIYFAEGEGDTLYLYDYRKDKCLREIRKGFNTDLLANLDGRYIAYFGKNFQVCIYDTKELKEGKIIMVPKALNMNNACDLAVISRDKVAFLEGSGIVYIIDWKKGMIEYSVGY